MIIAVGSTNPLKIEAVREALTALGLVAEVVGVETASGVNAQPVGDETYRGAHNRATTALKLCPQATLAIGIENGLFLKGGVWHDRATAVILTRSGQTVARLSQSVVMPTDCVEEARIRGFATTTAGAIVAERHGCSPSDPQAFLTNGKKSRKKLLIKVLKPLLRTAL